MFTAAAFTKARTCKYHRHPSTDEWIKKPCYIYTMEYYSAIKRNKCESVELRQMSLEPIIQSAVSQKTNYHILTHIMESRKMLLMNLFGGQEERHRRRG